MSDLERARALCSLGRYEDALPLIHRALAGDPTDPDAQCLLGATQYHLGRYDEAMKAAGRAITQDPTREWPHRIRALSLLQLGKKRDALAAAREAVRLAPDLADTHYVLTQAELANHRMADAHRSAQRSVALAPNSTTGHNAVALVMLQSRKWRDAEAACLRALAIDPEDVPARHNLGLAVSHQKGREVEGVAHLTEASKLDPSDPLSREQAVAAGRRYAAGGVVGIYLLIQFIRYAVTTDSEGSSAFAWVMVACFFALGTWLLVRRRRRLAELPHGVAELIRWGDRRVSRRTGRIVFWTSVGVAVVGLLSLFDSPRVGASLLMAGVCLAVLARWLTVPDA